jgi:sorbitol-6-phosphate 2-dehydrogenase
VNAPVAAALDAFGSIDVLVNNTGILIPRPLVDPDGREELTEEIRDKVVSVNHKVVFLCVHAAAREMLRSAAGGVIVNMPSESGMEGSEGRSVYAVTKAAYAMTWSWAKELGRHNIRVVGVTPRILEATALRSPAYERALAYTRGLSVETLRAGYIHGTTVNISGGKSRA